VWTQAIDYEAVRLISDPTVSLATYLASNPTAVGDTWEVTYLDDTGGNFQARYAKVQFFFDDPGDLSISVSPVLGSVQPNLIYGTEFGDHLNGSISDDQIIGRGGHDILSGGGGMDQFIYLTTSDSAPGAVNRDVILDFDANGDVIDLSAINVASGTFLFGGLNQSVVEFSVTYFHDNNNNTIIQVDSNGDTTADMQMQLNGSHALTAGNFFT
jgi:Ca2+-binding RTX toxin-like protein